MVATWLGMTAFQWIMSLAAAETVRGGIAAGSIQRDQAEAQLKQQKAATQEAAAQRQEGIQEVQTGDITEPKPLAMGNIYDKLAADTSNNELKKTSNFAHSGGIGTGLMV